MSKIKDLLFYLKMMFYREILHKDVTEITSNFYRKKGVKIGKNLRTLSKPTSIEPYLMEFGDNVTISSGVKFITHDNSIIKCIPEKTDLFGKIKIGNNCFIGKNSLILPGVELANNIIVGAGSVVTKSFHDEGIILGGNPAKKIGTIEKFVNKYRDKALNTKGMNKEEKRKYLLENEEYFIKK